MRRPIPSKACTPARSAYSCRAPATRCSRCTAPPGLSKQESWKEGEDHIALELEYLQILSDRTAEALCQGDTDAAASWVRAQYNFLDVHLDSWAPLLTAEVKKFAKTDFYRGLAFLTEGFLETDREVLEELLAED